MRIGVALLVMTMSVSAAAAQRQPWEWLPAERAQARNDPAKRIERLQANDQDRRAAWMSSQRRSAPADVIDGSRNPELYFVTELFEYLVRSSFVTLPQVYPHVVRQRTKDLFTNPADWNRFAGIVADYAKVLREEQRAANALDAGAVSVVQSRKCTAERQALREARRVFGKTRFDRMLYETVPTSMRTTFSADTDFSTVTAKALEREAHCQ